MVTPAINGDDMFENVLVGVDGRPQGRDAIALATRLTAPGGRLTLAHVHSGEVRPSHGLDADAIAKERDAAIAPLEQERVAAALDAEILSVASSSPGRGLHQQAEELGADLLVVGSTSSGVLGRAMLGDHTRGALNGAPCAVAVASRGYAQAPAPLARIGVAYNGSAESVAALATARRLATAAGVSIHALEVVAIPSGALTGVGSPAIGVNIEEMIAEADTAMQELEGVDGRAAYGVSGEELAGFSEQVDILIIGSRGYGPLRRLVLGSTTDFLERHARSSLLVLPRPSPASADAPATG
jgi:nucleotide-binding universal stress UspA family protein